jgi:hypothetical protein
MLKKLFGNVETIDLDNDGKIESLSEEIDGVAEELDDMVERLDQVNRQLFTIVEEEEAVVRRATHRIESAKAKFKVNEGLQEKIKEVKETLR